MGDSTSGVGRGRRGGHRPAGHRAWRRVAPRGSSPPLGRALDVQADAVVLRDLARTGRRRHQPASQPRRARVVDRRIPTVGRVPADSLRVRVHAQIEGGQDRAVADVRHARIRGRRGPCGDRPRDVRDAGPRPHQRPGLLQPEFRSERCVRARRGAAARRPHDVVRVPGPGQPLPDRAADHARGLAPCAGGGRAPLDGRRLLQARSAGGRRRFRLGQGTVGHVRPGSRLRACGLGRKGQLLAGRHAASVRGRALPSVGVGAEGPTEDRIAAPHRDIRASRPAGSADTGTRMRR